MAKAIPGAKPKVDPKLLVVLALVVVGTVVAWYFMFRTSQVEPASETKPAERFDTAVLRDQRFTDLVMPRGAAVEVSDDRFGRTNPFESLNPQPSVRNAPVPAAAEVPAVTETPAEAATSTPI